MLVLNAGMRPSWDTPPKCRPRPPAVVVNEEGRLDDTVREIEGILRAEKSRVARRIPHSHGA